MPQRVDFWLIHQQRRWMRPDAARYLRPDAARFLQPGTDPAEVYPALERKYPGQPRLPEGAGGGRYTFGQMNGDGLVSPMGRPVVIITKPDEDWDADNEDDGNGNVDFWSGLQLAGEIPEGLGAPSEEPPKIPKEKPKKSREVTSALRALSNWMSKLGGHAANVDTVITSFADWLRDYEDVIRANRDPPQTLQELMDGVDKQRLGYDNHHIIEKTAAERWGLTRSEIDDRTNLVSIPRLKHYQITGWYMRKNTDYGGISPREYLKDKTLEERRRVGLDALILFKVLKP